MLKNKHFHGDTHRIMRKRIKAPGVVQRRGLSFGQSPAGPVRPVGLAVRGIGLVIGGVLPGEMFRGVVIVRVVPG